ncbi:MAG: malto-oligosyltrehalose trehalohydrolase [Myxococcota bacterium]
MTTTITPLGAVVTDSGVRFRLWAPSAETVELVCDERSYPMTPAGDGTFDLVVPEARQGSRYGYRVHGGPLWPDPASRFQPDGVHGPSQVIDPRAFTWSDSSFAGVAPGELSLYELHVGTFTAAGSYDGVRERLSYLRDLGVTAIELLPLADFPGRCNWGYDPAALWAPSRAYGSPDQLRALVDAAHGLGLAVFLDVIYNHIGPDGAYVAAYGPILKRGEETPWGQAINLERAAQARPGDALGAGTAVTAREFLLSNALHWLDEYHIDGLRLDATFALVDTGPVHFLAELSERAERLPGPRRVLIAEDHPGNLDHLLRPRDLGGHGLDGVWADDFQHIARRCVTGEDFGYYAGYPDTCAALAETVTRGWYPHGQHAGALAGSERDPDWVRPEHFVHCIQNHDQIGNRAQGDRLHHSIEPGTYRALSALLLFGPHTPLLFMGQEWATSTPFLFFTDHNPELGAAVRDGRRREFASFPGYNGAEPDPQAPDTFRRSVLDWSEIDRQPHSQVLALYRDLLARRRELSGDIRAYSPIADALVARRGPHILVVALGPDLRVAADAALGDSDGDSALTMLWHSEDPAYSDEPQPPQLSGRTVAFTGPGAALLRVD